jgi:NAD(P)-dependent dehydrogenase (short-subunit alcohol dehydrogenase family)
MKDKIFIITGSSGIAAETIKIVVRKGARVFYIGLSENQCRELYDEIRKEGFEADYLVGDLTNPETAPRLVESCAGKYGRIDGLFNVAGSSGRKWGDGPIHECTEEGWTRTLDTNLTTQYRMCREVTRKMLTQEPDEQGFRGIILNMSSILGVAPEPKHFSTIAYAAAKGAIVSMSRTMAACYAKDKIRVNAIAPALANTRMSQRASNDEEIIAFMKTKQPLKGSMMTAREVAEAALFLLSSQSRVITGQVLRVDAGWSVSG